VTSNKYFITHASHCIATEKIYSYTTTSITLCFSQSPCKKILFKAMFVRSFVCPLYFVTQKNKK